MEVMQAEMSSTRCVLYLPHISGVANLYIPRMDRDAQGAGQYLALGLSWMTTATTRVFFFFLHGTPGSPQ